jgi:hypothetical protein
MTPICLYATYVILFSPKNGEKKYKSPNDLCKRLIKMQLTERMKIVVCALCCILCASPENYFTNVFFTLHNIIIAFEMKCISDYEGRLEEEF